MINEKYYNDIKRFPSQFLQGFDLSKNIKIEGDFDGVTLCGMGGSSFFVSLINDIITAESSVDFKINAVKGYDLPEYKSNNIIYLISSYSGNTEEVLSFYKQVIDNDLPHVVITSGGKLEQLATKNNSAIYKIPGGIQPRLSTGYFIAGIIQILISCKLLPENIKEVVTKAAKSIGENFNEEGAKQLAKELVGAVPVVYSTDNNSSLAHISKIKFNENTKIQAFWNFFPELNHNEMVGYTKLLMNPYFVIFQSQYTNPRNLKRISIFSRLMQEKNLKCYVFNLKGENILEEILMGYYFIDHVTFYLAEEYGLDPEPVAMVEDFKKLLES
jgi:glucose/mannose-6-phosphate isomerase